MAGKRPRKRASNEAFLVDVFSPIMTLGLKRLRRVPVEYALERIALKQWREVWLDNGDLAGAQPLRPEEARAMKGLLFERLAAVTITLDELKRYVGLYGPSHTMGMAEWKRLQRDGKRVFVGERLYPVVLEPEDRTERALEKLRLWPHPASVKRDARGDAVKDGRGKPVFADKAVRVYPPAQ
jgi:hypothetical protein